MCVCVCVCVCSANVVDFFTVQMAREYFFLQERRNLQNKLPSICTRMGKRYAVALCLSPGKCLKKRSHWDFVMLDNGVSKL